MKSVVLFIGTKRGLFIARSGEARDHWHVSDPLLAGNEVYHATIDPRTGTAWAATRHSVWGAHLHRSRDGGRTWNVLSASPHHSDARGLTAVWCLAPGPVSRPDRLYAGIEPAGLFVSDDDGESWTPSTLNEHPTTADWQPAGGALSLHSIACDPRDERRVWCAVSAGGAYRSDDGGASWQPINAGVRAEFLPDRFPIAGQCVHRLLVHPTRPDRLYQQNHCGTYRSDDGGDTWIEITAGLPSDFGYVLALDPADPDVLFVVPEESSHMRTTVGGMLRVFRTVDAGSTWEPLTAGLPQQGAWISLLRESMSNDTLQPVGVYFGTSGGDLFASRDAGDSWNHVTSYLPRILSISAHVVEL